jgi:hypothetical protein
MGRRIEKQSGIVPFIEPRTPGYFYAINGSTAVIEEPVYALGIACDSEQDCAIITSPSLNRNIYAGSAMETYPNCTNDGGGTQTPFFSSFPKNSTIITLKRPWYGYLKPPITISQFKTGTLARKYKSSIDAYFEPVSIGLPLYRAPIIMQLVGTTSTGSTQLAVPIFGRNRIRIFGQNRMAATSFGCIIRVSTFSSMTTEREWSTDYTNNTVYSQTIPANIFFNQELNTWSGGSNTTRSVCMGDMLEFAWSSGSASPGVDIAIQAEDIEASR